MKFEQLLSKATTEHEKLGHNDISKIYIGSLDDSSAKDDLIKTCKSEIKKRGLPVKIISTGSSGYYDLEPTILVEKQGKPLILYRNVHQTEALNLINKYLVKDDVYSDLAFCQFGNDRTVNVPFSADIPLFSIQNRVALRNCGYVDPDDISNYIISARGYGGLSKSLTYSPLDVINMIDRSGLKNPGDQCTIAERWGTFHTAPERDKYLVCNALNANPDDMTVKLLVESDPHSVLEGILISAYAIGASKCIICLNNNSSVLVQKLNNALQQMRRLGLLGLNIMDSYFSCEIEIRELDASLFLYENSAMLISLEGKQKPPGLRTSSQILDYLNEKPALVNRPETFSKISAFFQNDSNQPNINDQKYGQDTQVISLKGQVAHKYTVEVPLTITLEKIVRDIGGGVPSGKPVKAIQFGGPIGSLFTADILDSTLQGAREKKGDSVFETNTLEVFDSDSCIVEIVNGKMAYLLTQSCGKCVFCREGTYQVSSILKDIAEGNGRPQDPDLLIELGGEIKNRSICAFGRKIPDPVLSSINLFREDFESHLRNNGCPRKKSS